MQGLPDGSSTKLENDTFQSGRHIDAATAEAAQALADHAFVFLTAGILAVALAVTAILAAARLARRYRKRLTIHAMRLLGQVNRIPVLRSAVPSGRVVVPTPYVALHLVLGLVATAAIVVFIIIAEEVVAGHTVAAFDRAFADALRNNTSPRWQQVFMVITSLGSARFVLATSLVIAVGLLLRQYYVLAVGWAIGQAGGPILNAMLKNTFERTRPEFADAFLVTPSWSFPSGHAMNTFVFCGLGAYVLFRFTRSAGTMAAVVALASAWCLVIGFTRLYLGVHFLSDVVAGLVAATAWVAVCVSGIEVALRRFNRN